MIDRPALLADLQRLLRQLEADLRERCDEVPEVGSAVRAEYDAAREAERTAQSFEEWRADYITQIGAAWLLSCVFVRFLEDNGLVDPPRIAGPDERLRRARDEHELYFAQHPSETDREYLLFTFDELARLPGGRDVFGEHNAVHQQRAWLSGDAARALLSFFQRVDPDSGDLAHDFTDPEWDARFLGDLYQDLSEAARKKYALLQTPEFVEEFILDRTLDPALDEFGLHPPSPACGRGDGGEGVSASDESAPGLPSPAGGRGVGGEGSPPSDNRFRMIDPACGSGHFLLGSFRRILHRWQRKEPGTNVRELVQRALDSVHGVDLNPYAVAIARFRLLVAALRACDVARLADAPAFRIHLACGDSLLHGMGSDQLVFGFDPLAHVYQSEDLPELRRILKAGHYHAVVANPPYVTPKDRSLNQAYRDRYSACHGKYALTVPFMQRLFGLGVDGDQQTGRSAGYVGQITSNSFMKREFGKKMIESFIPRIDLTHVIDTSGAYIPGHGTPTVILLGRNRKAVRNTVRTVMGIRGEPQTPLDPARGLVWSAIVQQIDEPGSESEFVTVADSPSESFSAHPWSIGGGGAAECKALIDQRSKHVLGDVICSVGFMAIASEDDAFIMPSSLCARGCLQCRQFVTGESLRDWEVTPSGAAIFPYESDQDVASLALAADHPLARHLWAYRTTLRARTMFGRTPEQHGMRWYEYMQFIRGRITAGMLIAFSSVATHNQFSLIRGGMILNRHAPVIALPAKASDDDYVALLGLLNSSTGCFWMKQVLHNKGSTVDERGARQRTIPFEDFWDFDGGKLKSLPVPVRQPMALARQLDGMAGLLAQVSPSATVRADGAERNAEVLAERQFQWEAIRRQMIALQEELDWQCYRLYGLTDEELTLHALTPGPSPASGRGEEENTPPGIELGQRAFEIVMARKMAAGELETTWFERHGSTPITEIPKHWPDDYRQLVERRIGLIESDRNIGLIEQPEYKRRWNTEPWDSQLTRALYGWLLDRLESYFDFDGRMKEALGDQPSAVGDEQSGETPGPITFDFGGTEIVMSFDAPPPLADVQLVSTARLADVAAGDAEFIEVAELYRGRQDFDVARLAAELVEAESVPLLPVLRYKPAGMDKRRAWERTWELQRLEDAIDARTELPEDDPNRLSEAQARTEKQGQVGDVPVPPKYGSGDFRKSSYWRLRGKLDVPKERWVSFPHCEGEDQTLVVAWAGYDHLQLARAVAAYFARMQEEIGGSEDPRLVPLLGSILELVPWLKQWHNQVDPEFNMRMGDYFESFVDEEARALGMTVEAVRNWQPPQRSRGRKRKRS